jgi:hypothetical protein
LSKRLWFAYFCLVACWGVLSYGQLGLLQRQGKLFAFYEGGRPYVSDFSNHYNAALLARRATTSSIDIYDPIVQDLSLREVIKPVKPELPFFLQYPPYFFSMVAWLAYFDLFSAWLAWCAVGFTLLLGSIAVLLYGNVSSRPAAAIATAAVLAAYPTWLSFRLGQTSLWAFPALTAFWILLRAGKYGTAGIAASMVFVKLQYGPIVLLCGLIFGGLRFFLPALASLAVMVMISGFTLGWENVLRYPSALLLGDTSATFSGVPVWLMQNFRGAFALTLLGETPATRLAAGVLWLFTAAGITWIAIRWMPAIRSGDQKKFQTFASIATLGMLVSSLHTFAQDYLFAAIPCLWLWHWTKEKHQFSQVVRALIIAFPIISWVFFLFQHLFVIVRVEPFLAWALALAVCVLADEFRSSA